MLATPGAEILVPSPHWPLHLQQCLLAGLRPRPYPLATDWSLDLEAVERAITPRTCAILLNSPGNPTGAVQTRSALSGLLDLARAHDLYILSDEAYEDFVYVGEHVSIAALERDLPPSARRVFSVFSFSKSHGMGTFRLGYVLTPNAATADALTEVQETSIMVPPTLTQRVALAALGCRDRVRALASNLAANRESMRALVKAGLLRTLPAGGWYVLVDVSSSGLSGVDFAHSLLLEAGVAVVPAVGFFRTAETTDDGYVARTTAPRGHEYVRLAFSGDREITARGIDRLVRHVEKLRARYGVAANAAT